MKRLCRLPTLLAVLLLSMAVQLPVATAAAKKRVVILPFSGPRGASARAGVARGLKRRATLISPKRYLSAARKLGVDPKEGDGIQATCAKIKCDAVITGSVKRQRRRYTVTVTVINASSGEPVVRRAATVRGTRRLSRAGAAIGGRLGGVLRKTSAPRAVAAQPAPPPPPPPPQQQQQQPPPDISDIPRYRPPTAGVGEEGEKEGEEEKEEKDEGQGSSLAGLFDVSLAVGLATRTAEVLASQNPANNGSYDGGMYPEIILRADFYPLVLATRSFFRNIGLGVTFSNHLTISSKNTEATDSGDVGTASRELLIDLKVRWPILSSATTPEIVFMAGFGMRDFNLDPNPVMTSFNYRFLRLGLEAVIPFGTTLAAAYLGGDARPLFSTGAQAKESYGERDGGFGYSARLGFCGEHRSGIMYFLGFEYLGFSANFVGVDASLAPLAEWPNLYEPSEQSDRFIRFWAGGGYSF